MKSVGGYVMRTINVRNLIVMGLLFFLPFALFWQVWWPNPAQRMVFEEGDFVMQHYPMRSFVSREYRQGRLPLWSPYTFSGEPAVAESLYTVFYPLSLWQILLPTFPLLALELEVVAYLGFAAVFTCLFVRQLTGNMTAGMISGAAFGLSGFLTSYPMLQMIILQVALWLPAGLWLLERGVQRRSLHAVALAGVAFGIAVLGGHFQTFLYVIYLTGAYFLFRVLNLRLDVRFVIKAAALLALIVVAIGAPQWLPSAEMAERSPRANLSYEVVAHGFAPRELLGVLRPNLGEWSPLYVGWIPLVLALLALVGFREAPTWFWGGVVLVSLLLSLGGNGFLYPIFHAVAPGFDLFRDQERIAFLVTFGLVILAGYGYAALADHWDGLAKFWLLLLALLFLDLYHAHNGVILQAPPEDGYTSPSEALTYLLEKQYPVARISSEANLPLGGNAGLHFRMRDVTGNGPLYQARYEQFLDLVPEIRWWQLLNVDHVVSKRTFDFPGISQVLEDTEQTLYVHKLSLGQRPVWITHDVELMPNQEAAIYFTSDVGKVDPLRTAVLETAPDPAPQPARGEELAEITTFAPQRIEADVTLSAPGVVVFSEIAYPGWIVHVNGERVSSLRAFGLLRAVALPAGDHEIVWRFRPVSVYVGATLTILTILGLGGAFIVRQKRSQRSVHELN